MGQDPDADLFYGYVWEDESQGPFKSNHDDPDFDWDSDEDEGNPDFDSKVWDLTRGVPGPYAAKPSDMPHKEWEESPEGVAAKKAYEDAKEEARRTLGVDKVELVRHGSYEHAPCDAIAVRASHFHTDWDGALAIDPGKIKTDPSWSAEIAHFCERTGAKLDGAKGPGWFLVASYG